MARLIYFTSNDATSSADQTARSACLWPEGWARPEAEGPESLAQDLPWVSRNKRLSVVSPSIHCLAVEFDDVAVRVNDVDLRIPCDGFGTELHLAEIIIGKIVAETFCA